MKKALTSEGVIDLDTPKGIVRTAAASGLIKDAEVWIHLIDQRNLSSHTYREDLAEKVYAAAKTTPPYVRQLIEAVKSKMDVRP